MRTALTGRTSWHQFKIVTEVRRDGVAYGHVLLTHVPIEVDGVGATYGGTYYVDHVTHCFTAEGHTQRFTLVRNSTGSS